LLTRGEADKRGVKRGNGWGDENEIWLVSWIIYMCREFFFNDVEQLEAREWRSTDFIYIFIVDALSSRDIASVLLLVK
jgi:hypothetical protein